MLAALGAAVATEGDTAEGAGSRGVRPGFRTPFLLYAVTDWKGDVTYRVAPAADYGTQATHVLRANRFLKKAQAAAAAAWSKDPKNAGVPFPVTAPRPIACRMVGRYHNRAAAEAALKARQQAAEKQRQAEQEKEKQRLAALAEADRAKAIAQAKQLAAAQHLYQGTLGAIVNELGNVPPARPPVTILGILPVRGIRPIRVEPTDGIRPDRP